MTAPSLLRPAEPKRAAQTGWLADTVGRLVEDVRTLLPVDGCAFLKVDGDRVQPLVASFDSADLRAALAATGGHPYDDARPDLAELAIQGGRSLLLPRVEAWEAAAQLRESIGRSVDEDRAREVWETFRAASVIACPLTTAEGRPLGVLVAASLEHGVPLRRAELRVLEVLADVAALAVHRAELLDREGRRAREEVMLKRAAEDISASLELDEVYARIIRHALATTGGTKAAITRVNARAGEVEVPPSLDFSPVFTRRRYSFSAGMLGSVARSRTPY